MNRRTFSPSALVALSIGVIWATIALLWLIASSFQAGLQQSDVANTLMAIASVSVGLGVFAAFLAAAARRLGASQAAAVAVPLSLVLFLEVVSSVDAESGVLKLVVAVACATLAYIVLVRLLDIYPALRLTPGSWLAAAAGASAVALALTALSVTDTTGRATALTGAAISVSLLIRYWLGDRQGVLTPMASLGIVLLSSAALAIRIPVQEPGASMKEERPSVLLITIDTLRADHVGAYGYDNARTAHLDSLASKGIVFLETVSPNVFTGPSHASILSGLLPESHGVLVNRMRLSDKVPTLAEFLREEGYTTAAFVSGYTTEDKACGLPSRFDVYNDDIRAFQWLPEVAYNVGALRIVKEMSDVMGWYVGKVGQGYRMGSVTADSAIAWINAHTDRTFFAWTHFYDPHIPYRPPKQYVQPRQTPGSSVSGKWYALNPEQRSNIATSPENVAEMIALYDAEIAYVDDQIGRILDAANRAAPKGNLLIVVTSDHGEAMGEHGMFWFRDLYDPTLMVPLIVVPQEGIRVDHRQIGTQVRLIDVAPTILDLLGIKASARFDGESLIDLILGGSEEEPGPAVSGVYTGNRGFARERHSVRADGWKLIQNQAGWDGRSAAPLQGASSELYSLKTDPAEVNNVLGSQRAVERSLSGILEASTKREDSPDTDLTPAERERLRSLGYLQ